MPPERDGDDDRRPGGIQSVDRAVQILEILARNGRTGVSEVATELGVHKSTASRLLSVLESRSMVEQSTRRGKYEVGVGLLRLAGVVSARLSVVTQARPTLERLADELGETVNLAVSRSGYAVNLDQAMGPSSLTTIDWIGNLTPLHATASGKIFLAALTVAERDALIGRRALPRHTPATITSRRTLDAALELVVSTGIATTHGELEPGLAAAAVAVRSHAGAVVGSVSVSGPDVRFDPDDEALGRTLLAAGAEISARLGHDARL